ncbi:MAG: type IV pili twitching motility protein PilT, partial [Nitrospirota bacterium]|nr:type IV pili twitching motility protein PilT [Nitrospirota bacterium]
EAMEQGVQEGCQTFDTVMFELYKDNKISLEQALLNADSANNVRLKIKLSSMERQAQGPARGEGEAAGRYQIRRRPS